MIYGPRKAGRRLACPLRTLSEYASVWAGDDHIHHILDSHEAFNELVERGVIFGYEARISEVFIVYCAREENRSQLLEVSGHRFSPRFDVVPAQGRTGDRENETGI
jgi:hypothetical protein